MKEHSDDEEGFVPSEFQIKKRNTIKVVQTRQNMGNNTNFKVYYRYAHTFIKKQPYSALNTPLQLPCDDKQQAQYTKTKNKTHFQHPYIMYATGQDYILRYSRASNSPLINEKQYCSSYATIKVTNNIEQRSNTQIKQVKDFQYHDESNINDLVFDSRFQNGNLLCAYKKYQEDQYHLFISNDTNTSGYNQWFYFSVQNMKKDVNYKFKIVNYRKYLNFYKNGNKIAMFSMKDAEQKKSGWRRCGNKILFQQSTLKLADKKFYTLSFQLKFPYEKDYVMIASNIPYSYSKLLKEIKDIQKLSKLNSKIQFTNKSICSTVCNNGVPEITIKSKNTTQQNKQKYIVILARQHPGQVWSSYMVQGIMRQLIKQNPQNQYLFQNYIFKIYPMINVDGVIYGNFRCDITGVDLNRRWKQPSKIFHPQLYEIKRKIISYHKKNKIQICLDLHGHSKKYNIFCYSCKQNSYTCRILPYIIQSKSHHFYFPSCTFGLSKDKQSTARAVISKIMKSQNVLTIQTSFYGQRKYNNTPKHFNPIDIYNFGKDIIKSIRIFTDKKSPQYLKCDKQIRQNFEKYKKYDQQNQQQSGSDSQPQKDQIDFKIKINSIFDKKYQQQFKSFQKQDNIALIHHSTIIFDKQDSYKKQQNRNKSLNLQNKQLLSPEVTVVQRDKPKKSFISKLKQYKILNKQSNLKKNQILNRQKSTQNENKSKNQKFNLRKSIKKFSFNQKQKKEIEQKNFNQDSIRMKNWKQIKQQQEQRVRISSFINKFQRFMPNTISYKGKGRLQSLQSGLDNDDPSTQLNRMLQNKRLLQLAKIRKSIEDSTQIAQRQGKIKIYKKQQGIIDFKQFKNINKFKQQIRKIGVLSQRYLQ